MLVRLAKNYFWRAGVPLAPPSCVRLRIVAECFCLAADLQNIINFIMFRKNLSTLRVGQCGCLHLHWLYQLLSILTLLCAMRRILKDRFNPLIRPQPNMSSKYFLSISVV